MAAKKKRSTKKKSSNKPIGFVKDKKGYKLVYGSKSNPRLGKNTFKTKAGLLKKARKLVK